MKLYIDKDNLFSLLDARKENPSLYEDCVRMMRKNLDVRFNFLPSALSSDEKELFDVFFQDLNCYGSAKSFLDIPFPERPLKANCYNFFTQEQLSSVYLLNDFKAECIAKRNCILIGTLGEELKVLSQLFFEDYQYTQSVPIDYFRGAWECLSKWVRPLTDIIFIDRFILDDCSLYESNLLALLNSLTECIKECRVNLVIIVSKGKTGSQSLEKIKNDLEKKLLSKSRKLSVNVTIVPISYDLREHDRMIVTNYMQYSSGDTFNYFNSKKEVKTMGRNFFISSLASITNEDSVKKLLIDIQKKINCQKKRNSEFYVGSGNCNYLKIN